MHAVVQQQWDERDGARLLQAMEMIGLSQRQLAVRLGVSKNSVNDWVHGRTEPSIRWLRIAAATFGWSIDELLGLQPRFLPSDLRARQLVDRLAALASPLETNIPELLDVARSAREHAEPLDRRNADSA